LSFLGEPLINKHLFARLVDFLLGIYLGKTTTYVLNIRGYIYIYTYVYNCEIIYMYIYLFMLFR